jgi:hypothetical protein
MKAVSNYCLSQLKELFGKNRNLHNAILALAEGKQTAQDIDSILEELQFLVDYRRNLLYPVTLIEAQKILEELRQI